MSTSISCLESVLSPTSSARGQSERQGGGKEKKANEKKKKRLICRPRVRLEGSLREWKKRRKKRLIRERG